MPPVPLCQHIKTNGELCGCPALKDRRLCYFHDQAERRRRANARRNARETYGRKYTYQLPLLEDANAIQVAIMETIEALLDGRINHRYAGLIFYALQTASANLKHTTFKATSLAPRDVQLDELLDALRAIPDPNEKPATPAPCHPERSMSASQTRTCGAEGPSVSSPSAETPASTNQPSDGTMTRSHDRTIPKIHAAAEPPFSFFGSPDLRFSGCSSVRPIFGSSVFHGTIARSPDGTIVPNTP